MIENDIIPSRTEVMSMAREAGLEDEVLVPWDYEINMIAALIASQVAAKERETCAKVLDHVADEMVREMEPSTAVAWVQSKAESIRARGRHENATL